jgi:hypothetical protein
MSTHAVDAAPFGQILGGWLGASPHPAGRGGGGPTAGANRGARGWLTLEIEASRGPL